MAASKQHEQRIWIEGIDLCGDFQRVVGCRTWSEAVAYLRSEQRSQSWRDVWMRDPRTGKKRRRTNQDCVNCGGDGFSIEGGDCPACEGRGVFPHGWQQ